ncbi:hypothetical protein RQP46_001613 [Phenoliferia psychrophenolica]
MSTNFTPSLTDPPFVTPTWTLVDELPERDADDDEWEEDEVMYVTLDFGRHMKPEGYHHVREVQLINVNAATPYARLGGQIFRGQHEELIGSEILLQHKDVRPTAESSKSAYRPFATTSSRIVFHPISIGNVSITKGSTRARTGKPKAVPKPKAAPKKKEPVYDEDGQLVVEKKKVGRPKGSKNKAPEDGEPKKERKKRGPNKTKVPTVVPGTSRSPANIIALRLLLLPTTYHIISFTMSDIHFQGYAIHDTAKYTDFKVIDFTPKTFGEYDIDIKINACDVHTLTGGWGEPILPLISGHEVAGIVTKVGPKVTEFKVGDRAGVGAQVCSCFECGPCKSDNENYCVTGGVDTYNAKYENGDIAHGGYSSGIRVHERFVFPLPEGLSDEDAAPMLCGGLTVFAPMLRFGVKKGTKVGIAGLGGLGHFAVQFAAALGADVTVFSHQADKEADAKKMGASNFVLTTNKDFAKQHAFEFDFILSTIDDAAGIPLPDFFSMLRVHGNFHSCGLPDKPFEPFSPAALASNGASLSVSHIGSKKEVKEMLKLAVAKGVTTYKEVIPMSELAKGIQAVKDNKVRYRYVLKPDFSSSA